VPSACPFMPRSCVGKGNKYRVTLRRHKDTTPKFAVCIVNLHPHCGEPHHSFVSCFHCFRVCIQVYRAALSYAPPKKRSNRIFINFEIMSLSEYTLARKSMLLSRWLAFVLFVLTILSSPASSFVLAGKARHANGPLHSATIQDTPTVLPEFASAADYLAYMDSVAALPQGFATGTADGKFISVEAPSMGPLPIRGTIIQLTSGPTESWAAVFTKNKVRRKC
jgi:hypothetical protein